jgi:RNA polymerase sigma-70 factor (ECF subfamily)
MKRSAMADADRPDSADGLALLLAEHRSELLRFLAARSGTSDAAEDLLQELWLRVRSAAPGPIANGRAYLFRAANNLVLDRVRARQRRMRRDREWLDSDGVLASAERPSAAPDAEAMLLEEEEIAVVRRAVETLPNGARRAIILYRFEGHGQADVARIMGISRSGVEKHLALAMRRLRDALRECGYFETAASSERERTDDTGRPKDTRR